MSAYLLYNNTCVYAQDKKKKTYNLSMQECVCVCVEERASKCVFLKLIGESSESRLKDKIRLQKPNSAVRK